MRRLFWPSVAFLAGLAVGVVVCSPRVGGPGAPSGLPESVEVSRPGGGPRPVRLVPVFRDTGDELVPLSPADPRIETWRVVLHYPRGRDVAFVAQPR